MSDDDVPDLVDEFDGITITYVDDMPWGVGTQTYSTTVERPTLQRQDAFDYALTLLHAIGEEDYGENDALDSWMTRFDDLPESYDERMDSIFIQHWVHVQLELLQLGRVERFATRDEYDEYLEASFRRVAHAEFRDE